MNAQSYHFTDYPAAHSELFEAINSAIDKAFDRKARGNNTIVRESKTGTYFWVNEDNELVEMKQLTDDAPEGLSGWWIATEAKNRWYSDPMPTLKRLKASMGII